MWLKFLKIPGLDCGLLIEVCAYFWPFLLVSKDNWLQFYLSFKLTKFNVHCPMPLIIARMGSLSSSDMFMYICVIRRESFKSDFMKAVFCAFWKTPPHGLWQWTCHSSVFDTIDLKILSLRLEHIVSVIAQDWFKSYLSDRFQFVNIYNNWCMYTKVSHAVSQGSVLGPIFFTLKLLPLGNIIRKHHIILIIHWTLTKSNVHLLSNEWNY